VTVQAAVCTTVEAPVLCGRIAANEDHQLLSGCDWDNGMNTPAIGFGGTRSMSPESDDIDLRHARRDFEILRSARVVKRFMVRKRVWRSVVRHDDVTGVSAAPCQHRNSYAAGRMASKI
jgi:hypothetical protein